MQSWAQDNTARLTESYRLRQQRSKEKGAGSIGDKLSLDASCQGGLRKRLEKELRGISLSVRKRGYNKFDIGFSLLFNNA